MRNTRIAPHAGLALAQYVHALRADALAETTREAALRCVLDLLCAVVAGFGDSGARAARRSALALFGSGQADIWFAGIKASPCASLLANSAAASALDLDDGCRQARGHPGAAVVPAAWATLQALPEGLQSGDEFLTGLVAGYEVGTRMSRGRLSYSPSGAWSPHAVIAAAGKLRHTRPEVMVQAWGIAAQCAPALPGLAGLMGSDVKEGIPWGSVTGLVALELAQEGFTGPVQVLDSPDHFCADRIVDGLGGAPLIEQTYFKPYACCRHIHAALQAYGDLSSRHGFRAEDVMRVDVHTYRATFNLSNLTAPSTLVEAQYSVPCCVALCALFGPEALLPISAMHLRDAAVLAFAKRVNILHDPEIEPLFPARSPARVTVTTRTGVFASDLTDPRGDPATAFTWDELEAKFRAATRSVMRFEQQQEILAAVGRLRQGDIHPLRLAVGKRLLEPSGD